MDPESRIAPELAVPGPASAGRLGRTLRLLAGAALLVLSTPYYFQVDAAFVAAAAGVVLALTAIYAAGLFYLMAREFPRAGAWALSALALLLWASVYVLGMAGGPIFGRGEGQLGALTFMGVSLLVAGLRAERGCEVLSIPGAVLGHRSRLPCLFFGPADEVERRFLARRNRARNQI